MVPCRACGCVFACVQLLYLNEQTFMDREAGAALADEVRLRFFMKSKGRNVQLILVHETREEHGGCEASTAAARRARQQRGEHGGCETSTAAARQHGGERSRAARGLRRQEDHAVERSRGARWSSTSLGPRSRR